MTNWLKSVFSAAIDAAHGRHTLFTMGFFFSGNLMHWFHRLDGTYITFMVTLLGFVLGHSVKEDYFGKPPGPPQG
jgi:hypothetical protein